MQGQHHFLSRHPHRLSPKPKYKTTAEILSGEEENLPIRTCLVDAKINHAEKDDTSARLRKHIAIRS